MTRRQRRLILIGSSLGVLAIAATLVLGALRESIVFFNSPTDIVDKHITPGTRLRIGGLVKPGSLTRGDDLQVRFAVTDGQTDIAVKYQGIVPDCFERAKAWWQRVNSNRAAPLRQTPCLRSMTNVTCRERSSML